MKVKVISIPVQDQGKALAFYTNKLGFVKKVDVPLGEDRWLSVVSKEEQDGPEVLLEPHRQTILNLPKHIKKRFLKQEFRTHNLMLITLKKSMNDL